MVNSSLRCIAAICVALPFAAANAGSTGGPVGKSAANTFDYPAVENAINAGHFVEAKSLLGERLTIAPRDGYAHLLMGIVLSEINRPESAEAEFLEAMRLRPQDPAPHTNLGNLLAGAGRLTEAAKQFEAALILNPRDATSLFNLASVEMSMKKYRAAMNNFEAALQVAPNDVRTLLGLLQAQLKSGLSERSKDTAERLLTLPNLDEQAIQIAGALQGEARNYAEAIRIFEKGAQCFPDSLTLRFNLGLALQKAGNVTRAKVTLESLRSQKDWPELENILGEVYEQQRQFLQAVRSFQKAAEMEPKNESYRFDYASELLAHLNFEAARLVAEPAVQEFPESVRMNVALGVAIFGLERFQEAQTLFIQAAHRFPDAELPLVYVSLCAEASDLGLSEKKQLLTSFYQRHPTRFMAAYLLGRAALNDDEPASAVRLLQTSIRLRADYAPARFQLGLALAQLGRTAAAVNEYLTALKLDRNNTETWYRLTLAYRKLGQTRLAKQAEQEFRKQGEATGKSDLVQTFLYSTAK